MGETVAANLISTVNALCLRSRQETFSLTLKLLFCENVQLVLAQFFVKMENLRQRKRNQPEVDSTGNEVEKPNPETSTSRSFGSTFWLARIVFLRGLAAIYFVAFFISFRQVLKMLQKILFKSPFY